MSNDNEQGYAYSHKFSEPYTYMEVYTTDVPDEHRICKQLTTPGEVLQEFFSQYRRLMAEPNKGLHANVYICDQCSEPVMSVHYTDSDLVLMNKIICFIRDTTY